VNYEQIEKQVRLARLQEDDIDSETIRRTSSLKATLPHFLSPRRSHAQLRIQAVKAFAGKKSRPKRWTC